MARKPKTATAASEAIVKPIISMEGHTHPFQKLEEKGELPLLKAVGYTRIGQGNRDFVAYTVTFKGGQVLSLEVTEPNLRPIAWDDAKVGLVGLHDSEEELFAEGATADGPAQAG